MAANINSNFPSIHLIHSSIQGSAKQQQIQALTTQVNENENKIAKIDKEIVAREKIIEAAETGINVCIKGMQICEESIVLLHKMESILEKMIANNAAAKAYSKASDCFTPGKSYTTPYDEAYEESFKRAMDTSQTTESLGLKKLENIDFFDRISHNPVEKHYLFSMFTEWFSGFRSSSSSFFRWF